MKLDLERTIISLASGTAGGRRAIVRLSGRNLRPILNKLLAGSSARELLQAVQASSRRTTLALRSPLGNIDCRAYYWPDNRSYTGEPSAELHMIGSMPIVEAVIERACELGARIAERGEFTLRSFLSGKLDLTQAEAVLGVIEAGDRNQLEVALSQLGGNLTRIVQTLRERLLALVADLEAGLDFVEEDIEFVTPEHLQAELAQIRVVIDQLQRRMVTRDSAVRQPRCILVGSPNVGKSSLFNALVGFDRAIVTNSAGTTRDVVSFVIRYNNREIEICDAAGIETTNDASPRALAQSMLANVIAQADVLLFCIDPVQTSSQSSISLQFAQQMLNRALSPICIIVGTKLDLMPAEQSHSNHQASCRQIFSDLLPEFVNEATQVVLTSASSGEGIAELKAAIFSHFELAPACHRTDFIHQTAIRCGQCIHRASLALSAAEQAAIHGDGEEIVASELRMALEELGAMIGEVHTEDILGEIFSRFCIGK